MTVSQKATLYLVGVTGTKSKICIGAKESQLRLWTRNINSLKPSGYSCPSKFSIQRFYISHSKHIGMFCVDLKTAIISVYSSN